MQFILIVTAVIFLHAVASTPLYERSSECNFNGYEFNGRCNCVAGTHGNSCQHLTTRMCGHHGECGDMQYCLFKNIDCLYSSDCKDMRGWCLPIDPNHS